MELKKQGKERSLEYMRLYHQLYYNPQVRREYNKAACNA